jgi:hypothetical protein
MSITAWDVRFARAVWGGAPLAGRGLAKTQKKQQESVRASSTIEEVFGALAPRAAPKTVRESRSLI